MLAFAIALLFTCAAILAVLTIADSAIKARVAYARLLREADLMRAGYAMQVEPREMRVRRTPMRAVGVIRDRRMQALRQLPACAAA